MSARPFFRKSAYPFLFNTVKSLSLGDNFDKDTSRDISSNSGSSGYDTRPDFERKSFAKDDLKPTPNRSVSSQNDVYFSKQEPPTPKRKSPHIFSR